MAETEDPSYGSLSCFIRGCVNPSPSCYYPCYNFYVIPPPPPPPPPPSSQNHIAPYLIATVCILGISFLLLSTCTIILRLRFTGRRRGVSPISSGDSLDTNNDDGSFVDHPIWHITTVGLSQSVIDSITAFKYKKIDGFWVDGCDSSCSICLAEFEEGDDLRLLPKCSHAFHVLCVDTWFRSHKNCPLCRAPIVNEVIGRGNSGGRQLGLRNSGFEAGGEGVDLSVGGSSNGGLGLRFEGGEGTSHGLRERGDVLGELPVLEGIRIAEVLKKNRELRVFSDLSENRFRGVEVGVEQVRRSNSFGAIAALAVCGGMAGNEGSSSDRSCSEGSSSEGNAVVVVVQEKKIDLEKGGSKGGSSMSGLLMKSLSNGQSLQKGTVSMMRSLSSSSRFFSFRRTKSQASILPL